VNKKKKDSQLNQSDIHTIVDLPLEAVIAHIRGLSQNYNVKIENQNSDKADFRIRNKANKNTLKINTKGTIRRWNGTFTRLDADYNIRFTYQLRTIFLLGILFIAVVIVPTGFILSQFIGFVMAYLISILGWIPVFLYVIWRVNTDSGENSIMAKQHNRLIYTLVDELGVKLKQKAASLDFDGTDDNLELLLSEEKYKHFRVGDDGELNTP
jgi:hypothetical protein